MLTLQEVFDKAATHLLKQGARCENEYTCLYRGPNGTMCAVGALINDDAYSISFESWDVREDSVKTALEASGVDVQVDGVLPMLRDLQTLHDGEDPHTWPDELRWLAEMYALNTEAIDALQSV